MTPFLKTYTGTGAWVALETPIQDTRNQNTSSTKPITFVGRLRPLGTNNATLQLADNSAGSHPITLAEPVSGAPVAGEEYVCDRPTDLCTVYLKGNGQVLQAIGHLVGD